MQLAALAALSLILFMVIGFGIVYLLYGMDGLLMDGSGPHKEQLTIFKILQLSQAVGLFVLPPLILRFMERRQSFYFHFHAPVYGSLWLYAFAMMLVAMPLWDLLGRWNAGLTLPESLKTVEEWMRINEERAREVTTAFLKENSIGALLSNFVIIGLLASVGEELFFRGALQNIFIRWFKNPHVAIWFTAILFSAMHLQFYGFVPRLFLGALLGYLYWWSNCIWMPIFAHLVNNGYVVVGSFILLRQDGSLGALDYDEQTPYYIYVFSALALGYFIYRYYQYAQQERLLQLDLENGEELD